ncbi:VOC family protein [Sulfitobacter sp. F26204]|uniref:VOC family protein n=1 Tax=Sulfitobacter sp. F26204 TaxID=2996014 RepID=UPI00225E5585|nr:VOC family protein [Sulfitobacter sp. F26204]MCX7560024.1 VOC family protein [Sulfitobacter sp. F26204]
MTPDTKVRTCLWFQTGGLQAAEFYITLLEDSRIEQTMTLAQADEPIVVDLTLGGTPYQFLTAGDHHALSPAVSLSVLTDDQAETDRLWAALLDGGGSEMACGWLTDRFGVSWQIVPRRLMELQYHKDRAMAQRVHDAMTKMIKIDIAALEEAAATSRK